MTKPSEHPDNPGPGTGPGESDLVAPGPDGRRVYALEALLDLAYDASSYLRRHAKPGVRVATALLLAGSLAACGPSGVIGTSSIVQPLQQEVRRGLPTAPGRYALVNGTLGRDSQGVYYFGWRQLNDPPSVSHFAAASRIRLAQATTNYLEIPTTGDATLDLRSDTSIPLVQPDEYQRTGGYHGYHSYWYPWYAGSYHGPGYYDPPTRSSSTGNINGSTVSQSPRSFAERTVGLSRAVGGRAGGTGSGTAATAKSGASFATSAHGGAASAKSSSFSSGHASSSHASSS